MILLFAIAVMFVGGLVALDAPVLHALWGAQ